MPPVQYLWHLRLKKARELLEAKDFFENVKQIRAKVGIKDPSHFTQLFKAKYGASPSEYRKQHWAKIEAQEVETVYSNIFKNINDRYAIGYYPTNQEQDGKIREVKIEVRNHPEYIVTGRKTYFPR